MRAAFKNVRKSVPST